MNQTRGYVLAAVAVSALFLAPNVNSAVSEQKVRAVLTTMNGQLAAMGRHIQISQVEIHANLNEGGKGQIIYFNDRAKQMGSHWVPFDPYRGGIRNITWVSDISENNGIANGCSLKETQDAVDRAMVTWNSVKGVTIPLEKLPDSKIDLGCVQCAMGFGGMPGWNADITQAGWLPQVFFDSLFGPNNSILGVTFTFVWLDGITGVPTDMDKNGKQDVAFREVYYNNAYQWAIDPVDLRNEIDVESVVLHENGHSLSLDHFGKLFETTNGMFHWSPLAVMNAGYVFPLKELTATDYSSFYSIWRSWPKK